MCNRSYHETCMEFRLVSDVDGPICFDCLRKKVFILFINKINHRICVIFVKRKDQ